MTESVVSMTLPPAKAKGTKPPKFYMPQLDVMRFFAFLSVFLLHCLPAVDVSSHVGGARIVALFAKTIESSGRNGVGLFFLLSSYLITELLTRERKATGAIHLKMFYMRRILRIWPLYYFVVLIGLLIQPLNKEYHLTLPVILSFLFFVNNWHVVLYKFLWTPIMPLWTVSAEEQFYLVWPFAMRKFSRRTMLWLCSFAIVLLPLITYRTSSTPWKTETTELVATLLFFPLGGILSMLLKPKTSPSPLWKFWALFFLGLGCWIIGGICAQPNGDLLASPPQTILGKAIVAVGTVVIFMSFLRSNPAIWPQPLVYLGKISFGLYVYHHLVYDLVKALTESIGLGVHTGPHHSLYNVLIFGLVVLPATLLGTIGVSALSYRYLETPFLQLKDRFAVVHSRDI
jgi:peptidoglycan/LPS O-acetylase OafA/YrhL